MASILSKNKVLLNLFAIVGYIAIALCTFFLMGGFPLHIIFWLPFGFSIMLILLVGTNALPGLTIATLLSHLIIFSHWKEATSVASVIELTTFLSFVELATVFLVYKIIQQKTSRTSSIRSKLTHHSAAIYALVLPLLFSGVQMLLLVLYLKIAFSVNVFFPLYFGNALVVLVMLNVYSLYTNGKKTVTKPLLLVALLLALLSIVLLSYILDFSYMHTIILAISLIIYLYGAIFLPSTDYAIFLILTITGIVYLFNQQQLGVYNRINHAEFYSAIFLLTYFSQILKKRAGKYIKDENTKLMEECSKLNENLLEEIEQLEKSKKEISQQQIILTEAQSISGIATWRYDTRTREFHWITNNPTSSVFNFGEDGLTLRQFRSITHPDDLHLIDGFNKLITINQTSFEFEIRLKNEHQTYSYYWIKGQTLFQHTRPIEVLGLIMDISDRKMSEQTLLEREQRYQALFNSNMDMVCVVDAETFEITDINPAFERKYGYKREEIIGKSFLSISGMPEETQVTLEYGKQLGHFKAQERLHLRRDGEEFYVEAHITKHTIDGKEMLFVISHDITRRREIMSGITEREQKFRAFFESDLIGMAEVSFSKGLLSFNNQLAEILGYPYNELKGMNLDQLTHPEDIESELFLFNQVITHKTEGYTTQKRFIAKNGTPIHCKVSLRSMKTTQGSISHFIVLVEDISVEKRTERELLVSRARLTQAQAVAKLGTIWFYSGLDSIMLSPEAYEILGFGSERPSLTRKDFFRRMVLDPDDSFQQRICDLENGLLVDSDLEQAFITPSGEIKYILSNFGVSTDEQKNVTEVLITLADITRIKNAEIALQEANSLKDQLFSIISHDLRSPVSSISQLIELYIDQKEIINTESQNSILQTLMKTSKETYALLEGLLEWANSQRTDAVKMVPINLATILEQTISLSKAAAEAKSIFIDLNIPERIPVVADEEMLKTVFRNLISNSIKFTHTSGSISISAHIDGENVEVSIADTGIGIPPKHLPHLFDDNIAFSSFGTNNEKGTGLGLKLVKKFIEKFGGRIHVDSVEGQGSIFTVSMPTFADLYSS